MTRQHRPITAVQLDDLLSQLTPETVAMLRQYAPTAHADQLRAAQHEAVTLIETAHNEPGSARYLPASGVDAWLRLGLLDAFCTWVAGTAKTCVHMPNPRRPEPVWSAAWKPGLVVCTYCLPMLSVHGAADRVCDCCGRLCAGPQNDDPIVTTTVWFGELAFSAGCCADCNPKLPAQESAA